MHFFILLLQYWKTVENYITNSLVKFLQACLIRKKSFTGTECNTAVREQHCYFSSFIYNLTNKVYFKKTGLGAFLIPIKFDVLKLMAVKLAIGNFYPGSLFFCQKTCSSAKLVWISLWLCVCMMPCNGLASHCGWIFLPVFPEPRQHKTINISLHYD